MTRLPADFNRRAAASTLNADSIPTELANSLNVTGMRSVWQSRGNRRGEASAVMCPRRNHFNAIVRANGRRMPSMTYVSTISWQIFPNSASADTYVIPGPRLPYCRAVR